MKEDILQATDEALVRASQKGDKTATDALLCRYANFVRGRAREFFLVGGEADDLMQEGMMGLLGAIDAYDEACGKSFKNFAYLCVGRRIIDAVKKSLSKKNLPLNSSVSLTVGDSFALPAPSPEEELILRDDSRELRQKMSGILSDFEFKVFIMYMDGMTSVEIAQTTNKPFKSVDNAIQRSKRKLQTQLKK